MTPAQLVRYRQDLGLTQRELADKLGTTVTTISRLETGTAVLDARWANHLELLFGELARRRDPLDS